MHFKWYNGYKAREARVLAPPPPLYRARTRHDMFDNIYKLDGVPVATVQLRFDGWVTELNDADKMRDIESDYSAGRAPGMDNLLYTPDAEFSCFADLALTSPSSDYYKAGEVRVWVCREVP